MCPKCILLPAFYTLNPQDPLLSEGGDRTQIRFKIEAIFELIFSPLHIDLRCGEGFIRLACLDAVGLAECGPQNPLYPQYFILQRM